MNRVVHLSGGTVMAPYTELGANYESKRPNDGRILTGVDPGRDFSVDRIAAR